MGFTSTYYLQRVHQVNFNKHTKRGWTMMKDENGEENMAFQEVTN